MNDDELLRAFVARGDGEAFRGIVGRYVDVVYAAARRQLRGRDPHLADDVTQAVFILLARKAAKLHGATLGGWLVNTARLVAKSAERSEARRQRREHKAATMHTTTTVASTQNATDDVARAAELEAVHAALDDGLAQLAETDRTALVLRYLQGKSNDEVAQTLGVSTMAATKRLSRAMAKLRSHFSSHGTDVTLLALGEAMLAQVLVKAPVHLGTAAAGAALAPGAASVAAIALADATTAAAGAVKTGLAVAASAALFAAVVGLGILGYRISVSPAGPGREVAVHAGGSGGALRRSAGAMAAGGSATVPASPTSNPARAPIRVGVYISKQTAVTPPGKPRGWLEQVMIMRELKRSGDLSLFPLIEPGSADEPELARRLRFHFPGKAPIAVNDSAAVRDGVDVIVANAVHAVPDDALAAIESAVRDGGVGLYVRQCLGGCEPGYTRHDVTTLRGLREGHALAVRVPLECEIVRPPHPILGNLATQGGDVRVPMSQFGSHGVLLDGSRALLRARSTMPSSATARGEAATQPPEGPATSPTRPDPPPAGEGFFPLTITELGAGRIVSCNYEGNRPTPAVLEDATARLFTTRAIRWLARRPLD